MNFPGVISGVVAAAHRYKIPDWPNLIVSCRLVLVASRSG